MAIEKLCIHAFVSRIPRKMAYTSIIHIDKTNMNGLDKFSKKLCCGLITDMPQKYTFKTNHFSIYFDFFLWNREVFLFFRLPSIRKLVRVTYIFIASTQCLLKQYQTSKMNYVCLCIYIRIYNYYYILVWVYCIINTGASWIHINLSKISWKM